MNNKQIYFYNQQLQNFKGENIKLPVKVNFYLQRNILTVAQAAEEIEQHRIDIGRRFGVLSAEGTSYEIPPQNMQAVNQELQNLFSLEQELPIHMFKLSDFDDIELTYEQMSAIMFMIQEEE